MVCGDGGGVGGGAALVRRRAKRGEETGESLESTKLTFPFLSFRSRLDFLPLHSRPAFPLDRFMCAQDNSRLVNTCNGFYCDQVGWGLWFRGKPSRRESRSRPRKDRDLS